MNEYTSTTTILNWEIVIQDGVTKLYNYNTIKEDKDKKRIISELENDDSVDLIIVAM